MGGLCSWNIKNNKIFRNNSNRFYYFSVNFIINDTIAPRSPYLISQKKTTMKTQMNGDEHCVTIRRQKESLKFFWVARFVFVCVRTCVVVCIGVRFFNLCGSDMCVIEREREGGREK